jgi:thiamine-monophosphate kinase
MASGEDDLIARYFRPIATHSGARGLIDDAAVLAASSDDLVVTTDAVVAGVHFLPDDPPATIARKALRVNLSDLAAKGAAPAGFVMTLALTAADPDFLRPFAQALGEDAQTFACPLLGGDTVRTPGPLSISITAFGRVPMGRMVGRSGAKAGDRIFVSGTIGDAALGLALLQGRLAAEQGDSNSALVARYRVPQPRVALTLAVRDHASAAMDVSDGLVGDLAKLCRASGVSASILAGRVPLSAAAGALGFADELQIRLAGGDDYEILCTVPPARVEGFCAAAAAASITVTEIGEIVAGESEPDMRDAEGQRISFATGSFAHF